MRFVLIDRILECRPGQALTAVKNLSLAEEYLADHFPGFPVLPGVLMVEALAQAGAWLIRETEDFAHSVVVLKSVKTVKFGNFVEPGRRLELAVEIVEHGARDTTLKAKGVVNGQVAVQGRLVLTRSNLRDDNPSRADLDQRIVAQLRTVHAVLRRGSDIPA